MVRLYRGQAAKGSGAGVPDWVKDEPKFKATQQATGRWWTEDPSIAQWYVNEAGESGHLTYLDVPAEVANASRLSKHPEAARFSADPENEVFLPEEYAGKGAKVGTPAETAKETPEAKTAAAMSEQKKAGHPHSAYTEMVSTTDLLPFREFDRSVDPKRPGQFEAVTESVARSGILEPVVLKYDPISHRIYLGEGNTRLAAAVKLGMPEVPVRVIRSSVPSEHVPGVEAPKVVEGTPPADMKPSDIGIGKAPPLTRADVLKGGRGAVHKKITAAAEKAAPGGPKGTKASALFQQDVAGSWQHPIASQAEEITSALSGDAEWAMQHWLKAGYANNPLEAAFRDGTTAAKAIYDAYAPVRESLRQEFGDTVRLYRVQPKDLTGKPKRTVLSFADDSYINSIKRGQEGDALSIIDVPIDKIVAVPVVKGTNYREFIVDASVFDAAPAGKPSMQPRTAVKTPKSAVEPPTTRRAQSAAPKAPEPSKPVASEAPAKPPKAPKTPEPPKKRAAKAAKKADVVDDKAVEANLDAIRKRYKELDVRQQENFSYNLDKSPFSAEELRAVAAKLGVEVEGKSKADATAAIGRALWNESKAARTAAKKALAEQVKAEAEPAPEAPAAEPSTKPTGKVKKNSTLGQDLKRTAKGMAGLTAVMVAMEQATKQRDEPVRNPAKKLPPPPPAQGEGYTREADIPTMPIYMVEDTAFDKYAAAGIPESPRSILGATFNTRLNRGREVREVLKLLPDNIRQAIEQDLDAGRFPAIIRKTAAGKEYGVREHERFHQVQLAANYALPWKKWVDIMSEVGLKPGQIQHNTSADEGAAYAFANSDEVVERTKSEFPEEYEKLLRLMGLYLNEVRKTDPQSAALFETSVSPEMLAEFLSKYPVPYNVALPKIMKQVTLWETFRPKGEGDGLLEKARELRGSFVSYLDAAGKAIFGDGKTKKELPAEVVKDLPNTLKNLESGQVPVRMQNETVDAALDKISPLLESPKPTGNRVVVSILDKTVIVYDKSGKVVAHYPAYIGTAENPTPRGQFRIMENLQPADPKYGPRWLGFANVQKPGEYDDYAGFHGWVYTPESLAQAETEERRKPGWKKQTGWCVQLANEDVSELAKLIGTGDMVTIVDTPMAPPLDPTSVYPPEIRPKKKA